MPSDLESRLARIRLAAFDVDGVFTDGRFTLDSEGRDSVQLHARDGMGVTLLLQAGVGVALVSGRDSRVGRIRAESLRIAHARFGVRDKAAALGEIAAELRLSREEVLFAGDDIADLPAFAVAGIAATVADGPPEVKARADLVTAAKGGEGAVREIAERILRAAGLWEALIAGYAKGLG